MVGAEKHHLSVGNEMMSIESLVSICLTLLLNGVTPCFVKTFLRTTFEHFPFLVSFFPITGFRAVIPLLVSSLRSSFLAFFSSQEYCLIYRVLDLVSEKKRLNLNILRSLRLL